MTRTGRAAGRGRCGRQQPVDELLAVPAPAPIELLVPPRLLPLDDPIVVVSGLDELLLPLGLADALLLVPPLDDPMLLELGVLLDEPMLLLELGLVLEP